MGYKAKNYQTTYVRAWMDIYMNVFCIFCVMEALYLKTIELYFSVSILAS